MTKQIGIDRSERIANERNGTVSGQSIKKRHGRIRSFSDLIRVRNCIAGGIATITGMHLAGPIAGRKIADEIAAICGVFLTVAFANVVNDIADIEVDTIGKSSRPIPSGGITIRTARLAGACLAIAAISASTVLAWWAIVYTVVLLVLSIAYSYLLKSTVLAGNVTVAMCGASVFGYGAAAAGDLDKALIFATVIAFLFLLSYEILKTIADKDDDERAGIRTVATSLGYEHSRRIYQLVVLLLTAAVILNYGLGQHSFPYLAAEATVLLIPSWLISYYLHAKFSRAAVLKSKRTLKIVWFLALAALWLTYL